MRFVSTADHIRNTTVLHCTHLQQNKPCDGSDVITVDVREGDDLENGDDDERKAGAVPVKQVHDVDAVLKAASQQHMSSQPHVNVLHFSPSYQSPFLAFTQQVHGPEGIKQRLHQLTLAHCGSPSRKRKMQSRPVKTIFRLPIRSIGNSSTIAVITVSIMANC